MSADRSRAADAHSAAMNWLFAGVQRWGLRAALMFMLGAFAAYVTGLLPSLVSLERLPALLGAGAGDLLAREGLRPGWGWLADWQHGDLLSLSALAATVGVVVLGYLALVPLLLKRRDWVYLGLVVLQLFVFAVSAGLLPGFRH
jgi:hypothetical protein